MSRVTQVPITPSVLEWVISESGYTIAEVSAAINVSVETFEKWRSEAEKPSLTQIKKLAGKLHRPLATFLLPGPPPRRPPPVEFRHPVGVKRVLNPDERRHIRRAGRLQEVVSWISRELGANQPRTPSASIDEDPALPAKRVRDVLGDSGQVETQWPSAAVAFDYWRSVLEHAGHIVLLFPLGKDSCRGFSIWDDNAPVVAINTAWSEEARIFTLFHEVGHLITRTGSACIEAVRTNARTDSIERWCERFAAEVLMPTDLVEASLREYGWQSGKEIGDLALGRRIARRHKVSLRAAVLRLIEMGAANWSLYDKIPLSADTKSPGGGGGGRNRTQIREDQFGGRITSLLVRAVEKDVLSRSQAVDFLDIPDVAFDDLARTVERSER